MISIERQEEIAAKLKEKVINVKCPMCENNNFIISTGYNADLLHDDFKNMQIFGENLDILPIISACCSNCGFVSSHNLKILGLYE